MANVFISHRTSDGAAAERLAREIATPGHTVWLDEWHIRLGDSIVEKINSGLDGASYLVLCYSDAPDGVQSPWTSREWMSALHRQLDGQGVRVLPVRFGGSAPAILADLKFADLAKDWDLGVRQLLQAIR
ncbi:toll/interleukin-1 receptor domain-containing protein [Streptomyces sp. SID13726]|uniref:toll/interleukin-1 receptor domain-containing protein n=1 Tax=Streptomyces sp. SID13726 TaxID=2706058 RepID=UPI0013B5C6A2|nr:toll/interleukin-1 receptor domain-containing protein [Streptomyces sp. SID13726]NEB05749.1 toll/interleukin-1 receptor domain-containing protein [Streptomyces sp. SID13726]